LLTIYRILSDILLSRLNAYADDIIGYHQCGFCHSRSTAVHKYCIRHILVRKRKYSEAVYQLFISFKKVYDSFRREDFYSIIIESGIPVKLVWLIKYV
jgi:hypothetical protein